MNDFFNGIYDWIFFDLVGFFNDNYKWIFSGIGVTFLILLGNFLKYVLRKLKKATRKIIVKKENLSQLKKQQDLPPKYCEIIDKYGLTEKVEIILAFEFKDTKREYVIYTNHEKDTYGNITVYVSEVERIEGESHLIGISDDHEWERVRDVLKELSGSNNKQPLYDKFGIEII